MAERWSLSEAEKDRVAAEWHRLRDLYEKGAPELWRGGRPEARLAQAIADLGSEAAAYAASLSDQNVARLDERGSDPVIERIDGADDGRVPRTQADS